MNNCYPWSNKGFHFKILILGFENKPLLLNEFIYKYINLKFYFQNIVVISSKGNFKKYLDLDN